MDNKQSWAAWFYEWRAELLEDWRAVWAKESPEYLAKMEQAQRDYEKEVGNNMDIPILLYKIGDRLTNGDWQGTCIQVEPTSFSRPYLVLWDNGLQNWYKEVEVGNATDS